MDLKVNFWPVQSHLQWPILKLLIYSLQMNKYIPKYLFRTLGPFPPLPTDLMYVSEKHT